MSGRYVRLEPGRYTLDVAGGEGPAGVQRSGDTDVRVGVSGGRASFRVPRGETVYYWWRGPEERPGVRLVGVSSEPEVRRPGRRGSEAWPTATTG